MGKQGGVPLHRQHRRRVSQKGEQGRVGGAAPENEPRAKLGHGVSFPPRVIRAWDAGLGFPLGQQAG